MNYVTYESFGRLQKCGHINFKQGVPLDVLQKIRKIQILKYSLDKINMKLNPKTIQLQQKRSPNQQQMNQHLIWALSFVKSVNLEEAQFFKDKENNTSKLLITFAGINFHQLEYLNLNSCNLRSIQFLTFLELPQLKRLILNNNDLTNLNSFAKSTFPKLFWIDLIQNQIKDAKGLHRSHLPPKLAVLDVTQKSNQKNQDTFTYLSTWFFKLPFEFINYIRKQQTMFLFKNVQMRQALQKYPDINFR